MDVTELFLPISLGLNGLIFIVLMRLDGMFAQSGQPNFFRQTIAAGFNRIKSPQLVVGANSSRYAPIYWRSADQPIKSDPSNLSSPNLQYQPKHLYHTGKGYPVIFALEGGLENADPLKEMNDDVQLQLIGQNNLKFIQLEVERLYNRDNPFQKIKKWLLIHGVVMVIGFIVVVVLLNNMGEFIKFATTQFNNYKPVIDALVDQAGSVSIPVGPPKGS